ncbi:4-hydroxyphenylacetate 3-hydroxylase N-terminal domain-containing protein [Bradyrhizobium sp. CIAT3101]|uniref:4-hydroxyphenylacetate 3-hydroxylase family protein n=1 Tax=Bradyrhizobium sp. CIAT3101 TaxID=439387 RepID=UPI0024B212BB|nr:4-hydroxyphenylacetate 3-hydroxylase N-terminal domain-containing protein [Bradyrhizobium sp. CIAT3101]WFU79210.1 4-hydroxyphenylacetate 3-hydroxylase N-terminal domain-containing protein [Bradyrhizobium sp. CIAT3101]
MNPQPKSITASSAGGLRSGRDFLESLNDGRQVFLDGELVKDVTKHPSLARTAHTLAGLFDLAAEPGLRDRMTFTSPKTGQPVLRAYQIPKTTEDLRARRLFSEVWAEATFGLMGRTPDHVASFFCGYAAVPEVFKAGGAQFAANVVNFYEKMRDNHLYASYAIVPPQIDRSKPAHKQADPTLYAGIVAEKDGGIVLKGAQQLATGGLYSDYIYLSCIHPLQPGDENYANGVMIPANAPGLKLYPRRPFGAVASNSLDYPLSGRFDEPDCFVVLDNVFVPWENVFIHRNIDVCRDQWWKTPAHAYGNCQAQTRYTVKLRFMIGLAKRINELSGNDSNPAVQVQMGELASLVSIIENMLLSQEVTASVDSNGVLWPSKTALYSIMALQSELNARMLEIIRELSGAAMITLPSSAADFENAEMNADIERYMQSGAADAKARVAVMRMAWDFIGSEFGSRQQQYEKFYGGASFLVKQNMFRNYDFKRATGLVEKALTLPAF